MVLQLKSPPSPWKDNIFIRTLCRELVKVHTVLTEFLEPMTVGSTLPGFHPEPILSLPDIPSSISCSRRQDREKAPRYFK